MYSAADDGVPRAGRGEPTPAAATAAVAIVLGLLTFALYARTVRFDYVNYDDDVYAYENAHVRAGLTPAGVAWAFSTSHAANWHPLTWLSLMADVSLFGDAAWGHHLTNAILHAANAGLLFLALRRLTGQAWPALAVAAVWAAHPLRVESVAWISERKDVLSGLFWMLGLIAYDLWRRRRTPAAYLLLLSALALGLMAKPILVALPVVLLLVEWWLPVSGRSARSGWRSAAEWAPLFLLALAAAGATVWAQSTGGSVSGTAGLTVAQRALNVPYPVTQYLLQTIVPARLAPFYPHPYRPGGAGLSAGAMAAGVGLIVVSIGLAIACARRARWVTFGIAWAAVTLAPVIGIVQVGLQSHADRYTYLPSIGLLIAIVWSLAAVVRRWSAMQVPVAAGVAIVLLALSWATHRQVGVWRDSELLWRHAVAVRPSHIAHANLGQALVAKGDFPSAERMYRQAIAFDGTFAAAHHGLAICLMQAGRDADARPHLERAVALDPAFEPSAVELAKLHARAGQRDAAATVLTRLLALRPNSFDAHDQIALLQAQSGELPAAIGHWRSAAALRPDDAGVLRNLGLALLAGGQAGEGVAMLRQAVAGDPDRVETLTVLAWTLATTRSDELRSPVEAARHAGRAVDLSGRRNVGALDALAAAHAAGGDFPAAVATAEEALRLATATGDARAAEAIAGRLAAYRTGRPFVQE